LSRSESLRAASSAAWDAAVGHPFVRGLQDGTLDEAAFQFYIRQDYLFLLEYARLLALGCARAPEAGAMRRFAQLTEGVLTRELELHRSYAGDWGITAAELEHGRPTLTTRAYTDFLLRVAALGDYGELVAALLPCMWGYHELATQLAGPGRPNSSLYAGWIDAYSDAEFGELAAWCRTLVDEASESSSRPRMLDAFLSSSRYELAFWDASWHAEPPLLGPDTTPGRAPAV